MPRLLNKDTGEFEFVPNELIDQAAQSGAYEMPKELVVSTPGGRPVQAAPGLAEQAFAAPAGEGSIEGAREEARLEELYGGPGGAALVAGTEALDAATLGGLSLFQRAAGDPDIVERRREARSVQPGAAIAGTVLGAAVPAALSGGAGAAGLIARATPAGAAARLGTRIAKSGPGGLKRAALGYGAEGAIGGLGLGVQELALAEDPLTFETAMGSLSSNVLLGGALSGGIGVLGKAAEKGLVRASAASRKLRASRDAEVAAARVGEDVADVPTMDLGQLRKAELDELSRLRGAADEENRIAVEELSVARRAAQNEKPWIALEGLKDPPAPIPPAAKAPLSTRRVSEAFEEGGRKYKLQMRSGVDAVPDWGSRSSRTVPEALTRAGQGKTSARVLTRLGNERAWTEVGSATVEHAPDGLRVRDLVVGHGDEGRALSARMMSAIERHADGEVVGPYGAGPGDAQPFVSEFVAARPPRIDPMPGELRREIKKLSAETFQADRAIDRILRNPKAAAAEPKTLMRALQAQEAALDRLQKIDPDLRAQYAANPTESGAREAALDTVAASLERNRAIQGRVGQAIVSQAAPTSPRLNALRTAREEFLAGQRAPKGFVQSAAEGAMFAGAAAAAAPLGVAAPIVGAAAARSISRWTFGRLARAGQAARDRSAQALATLLTGGARAVRTVTSPTALRTLSALRLLDADEDEAKPAHGKRRDLGEVFSRRRQELLSQVEAGPTGKPVMTRAARGQVAERLSGVGALSPDLADQMETHVARRVEYLAGELPTEPDLPGIQVGPSTWRPSDRAIRRWARIVAAVEDPGGVEERMAAGLILPEEAEAYRTVYPERFADFRDRVVQALPTLRRQLSREQRLALSIFTGVPVDPSLSPGIMAVMQGVYTEEPGTEGGSMPPVAQPQFGSISREQPTAAQSRANPQEL